MTTIKIKCNNESICLGSIYCPPRFNIKCKEFEDLFKDLGPNFLVGGDYNAKHNWWGSRLINPKGSELYKAICNMNYNVLSTGSPTYWPTDPRKVPDLLDFFVYSGVSPNRLQVYDSYDLSSDHSPIILVLNAACTPKLKQITDYDAFTDAFSDNIDLKLPLKNEVDINKAVTHLNETIHDALSCASSTIPIKDGNIISLELRLLIAQNRRLRKKWQTSRHPYDKTLLNRANKTLKKKLADFKDESTSSFLASLDPVQNNDFTLWKATKYLKRPVLKNVPFKNTAGTWCKSDENKAEAFGLHLSEAFSPHEQQNSSQEEDHILQFLDAPLQLDLPVKLTSPSEVREIIRELKSRKSPGHDGIGGRCVKALPYKGLLFLTTVFNSILRLGFFPDNWKKAEIIMILKPGKPENQIGSYRPISLLPIFSKMFEKILLRRIDTYLSNIIPDHQFGFRKQHGAIQQCHRVISVIQKTFEDKEYCSAAFLDIQQAFDKVWHPGLLFKTKSLLPSTIFQIIRSFLSSRNFYVKVRNAKSSMHSISAGVPQGSVIGPVLYNIFTSDAPVVEGVTAATYADDTAYLASSDCPSTASSRLQTQLDKFGKWCSKWRIKVNSDKCRQITFTLRRGDCSAVTLLGQTLVNDEKIKYLGMHLDRRLTWKEHIRAKRMQLKLKIGRMNWLFRKNSGLSIANKVCLYKTIIKPIWCYGIQLWGTACKSAIKTVQSFQSKTLRRILDAPFFVRNNTIHADLNIPEVMDEIRAHSLRHLDKLETHINPLAIELANADTSESRLKRFRVFDLPQRN